MSAQHANKGMLQMFPCTWDTQNIGNSGRYKYSVHALAEYPPFMVTNSGSPVVKVLTTLCHCCGLGANAYSRKVTNWRRLHGPAKHTLYPIFRKDARIQTERLVEPNDQSHHVSPYSYSLPWDVTLVPMSLTINSFTNYRIIVVWRTVAGRNS